MKINVSNVGKFIPEWNDNKSLPASDQLYFEYEYLSHLQREKHTKREMPEFVLHDIETKSGKRFKEAVNKAHSEMRIKADTDDVAILRDMKIKVHNLEDEAGNPIDTWEKLVDIPQTRENKVKELIDEARAHFINISEGQDSKNLE